MDSIHSPGLLIASIVKDTILYYDPYEKITTTKEAMMGYRRVYVDTHKFVKKPENDIIEKLEALLKDIFQKYVPAVTESKLFVKVSQIIGFIEREILQETKMKLYEYIKFAADHKAEEAEATRFVHILNGFVQYGIWKQCQTFLAEQEFDGATVDTNVESLIAGFLINA